MNSEQRTILITAALPYANGDIHLGHMVEHSIVDFWARFQKMRGHRCLQICADDTHGTPIMLSARRQGVTPEELVARAQISHERDFKGFEIEYDCYSSTHTDMNREFSELFFAKMKEGQHLETKSMEQLFCPKDEIFLPDRLVMGTCPHCHAEDQYGDSCDSCSATYNTSDLKKPRCSLCSSTPEARSTEHLFFKLRDFDGFLKDWVKDATSKEIGNKLKEWLGEKLQDWCISRDKPYFGFEIPGHPGKFFYVWVDAPIGYISATKEWCDANQEDWNTFWTKPGTEIYHCIGKDIMYFHCLFWPAMLKSANFNLPSSIFIHGMLTVNGVKMSKSKGTFINAETYLKHLDPSYLRFYLASKLSPGIDDMDMNFDDFTGRVNSELVGKITNVASRSAQMLQKLGSRIGTLDEEGLGQVKSAQGRSETIAEHFEKREFAKGIAEIRGIADEANKYFDSYEPWKLVKTDPEKTIHILGATLNLFRIMAVYLKPILPSYVNKVEVLFQEQAFTWDSAQEIKTDHELSSFVHLLKRLDPKALEKVVNETKEAFESKEPAKVTTKVAVAKGEDELEAEIEFPEFAKTDLRVAKIESAEAVKGADKLLKLVLDLGPLGKRQVFAGIKSAYDPETLVGRLTVMVANLKPRKMKFGMSEGMVLAAGPGGKEIFILSPDQGAEPGSRVS